MKSLLRRLVIVLDVLGIAGDALGVPALHDMSIGSRFGGSRYEGPVVGQADDGPASGDVPGGEVLSRFAKEAPMKRMVATCGLVCTDCDGYIATQKGDRAALEELARKAKADFGVDTTADGCLCDGCLATSGRKIGYCSMCEIRACAVAKKLANCAHCADYACEKLAAFFEMAKNAKPVLDAIHASL